MKNVHIGKLIEARRKEIKMAKTELAKRLGTTRQNVMMITYRKSIQVDLLHKLCVALNHDFFQHYVLLKNDELRKQMLTIIDQQQKQIVAFDKQVESLQKTIDEKLYVIDVLRGRK